MCKGALNFMLCHKVEGKCSCLFVGFDKLFQCRIVNNGNGLHCFFNNLGNHRVTDFAFSEGKVDNLICRIKHTGRCASCSDGLIGEA